MMKTFALALVAFAAGCMAHLTPLRPQTGIPGVVDVSVRKINGDLFYLEVYNASPDSIVIQRDGIVLHGRDGVRTRMQGGIGKAYVVPPGGHHAVNLRYDLAGLQPGEVVAIDFGSAIIVGPAPVQIAPLELRVE